MVAKEGMFTTLSKEPPAKFLTWMKMKRICTMSEVVPVENGTGTATVHGEPATLSCVPRLAVYI
jgi:hypothetical protein